MSAVEEDDRKTTTKPNRVRIFNELLQRNDQLSFLKNLVAGDEWWLLFKNIKIKKNISPKELSKKRIAKSDIVE